MGTLMHSQYEAKWFRLPGDHLPPYTKILSVSPAIQSLIICSNKMIRTFKNITFIYTPNREEVMGSRLSEEELGWVEGNTCTPGNRREGCR